MTGIIVLLALQVLLFIAILFLWKLIDATRMDQDKQHVNLVTDIENLKAAKKSFSDSLHLLDHKFVSKEDKTYLEVNKILEEAATHGEGLFLLRKLKEGSYLWRVNKKDIVELSPKSLNEQE